MSLLQFRRVIALTLIQRAPVRENKGLLRISTNVVKDIRYDNLGHLVEPMNKQGWKYGLKSCKSRPSRRCIKCRVPLCLKCFIPYHREP